MFVARRDTRRHTHPLIQERVAMLITFQNEIEQQITNAHLITENLKVYDFDDQLVD
jgi:hypothetical protein